MCNQFRISLTHILNQHRKQLVHECLLLSEECIAITDGTAEDTTDHITCFSVGRQLTVRDRERNGTDVVGNHTHGNILLLVFSVFCVRHGCNRFQHWLEYVRIIIGRFALKCHTKTFESHTGVDHFCGKRLKTAVCLAVVLHEYKIPDFNHLRMIMVHEIATGNLGAFFCRTKVDMNFGTRSARSCITHFPEIIVLVAVDDMIFRQELFPIGSGFVVTAQSFFGTSFEYGCVEMFRIQFQDIYQIFPCPTDGFFLEVIAERPVTEHFEHGMMVSIVSYLLQVIVLSAYAQTFLRVRDSFVFRRVVAQNNIFKLVHTRIGKHQGRVVFNHHWSRRNDVVSFRLKEILE